MYCTRDANRLLISWSEAGRQQEPAITTTIQHLITQLQQYCDRHATCFARDELTSQATAEQLAERTQAVKPIMERWLRVSQPLRGTARRQTGAIKHMTQAAGYWGQAGFTLLECRRETHWMADRRVKADNRDESTAFLVGIQLSSKYSTWAALFSPTMVQPWLPTVIAHVARMLPSKEILALLRVAKSWKKALEETDVTAFAKEEGSKRCLRRREADNRVIRHCDQEIFKL